MNKLRKKIWILVVAFILTVGIVSPGYAETSVSTVQAYQGVKIIYNGVEVIDPNQPYIINDSTYVPLRLIMNLFDKNIAWDGAAQRVLIDDDSSASSSSTSQGTQSTSVQNQNSELQSQISSLNAKISSLENELDESSAESDDSDISISDLEDVLNDDFADAGDTYFSDNGIDVTISLSGDEDDIYYTIRMDFTDADEYNDLTELSETSLERFLSAVESKITSEGYGSDYQYADITGKLTDYNTSSYYVNYDGDSYTFSWDEEDTTDISDIQDTLSDTFVSSGASYFGDNSVDASISLSGDEAAIYYTVYLDLSNSVNYADLSDINESNITSFMNAIESTIDSDIADTNYEDAYITGIIYDANNTSSYVKYDGSSYTFSWE